MRSNKVCTILVVVFGLMFVWAQVSEAAAMGTAFTYQGRLMDSNGVADGLYDFQFGAYESQNSTRPLAGVKDLNDINIIDGYFTVELDFGNKIYDGNLAWLEIAVRPGEITDPNAYVILSPRQQITPAPYAVYAASALISPPLDLSDEVTGPVIKGMNTGLGAGVQGETSSGAKGGVIGRHTGTGNYGYVGSSAYGIYGEIQTDAKNEAGIYGKDNVSGNYGYLGGEDSGVFGYSISGHAGFFDGDAYVSGKLGIGTTAPSEKLTISDGTIRVNSSGSKGIDTLTTGLNAWGVYSEVSDNQARAFYGYATSATSRTYGGMFVSDSELGVGVYGLSGASGGTTYGVLGTCTSEFGAGVYGYSVGADGYGILGTSTGGGKAGYFEGDVHVTGEVTKAYTEDTNNPVGPIAYAVIDANGVVLRGTPNLTCQWQPSQHRYLIWIDGEDYEYDKYVTVVTAACTAIRTPTTSSSQGRCLVYLWDWVGTWVQEPFSIVIYKP